MTEQDIDWGTEQAQHEAVDQLIKTELGGQVVAEYPEYPDNPHNHRYTISLDGRGPMFVVRGNTAQEVIAAFHEFESYGGWPVLAAAYATMQAQKDAANPLVSPAPPSGPMAPQGPAVGPPFGVNVSVPAAPNYVGPPVGAAAPPWQQQAPPQQQWGGGQQQGNGPQPQPQPPGWYKCNARTGPGFDAWKAMREANKDHLKGKISWGGKSDYWIDPGIAQWIAQQGWAVS